jgi:SNF2 family DNA or RNA helicase
MTRMRTTERAMQNKYAGRCDGCGARVEAGAGEVRKVGLRWAITCVRCTTNQAREASRDAVETSRATDAIVDVPAPAGLSYLPYQRAGISYMMGRQASLLADEMGLGKTIQAIGLINADPTVFRVLVICPASLKLNWQRELRRWLTRPLSVEVANGSFPISDVVVINYDVLAKHREAIDDVAWDLLIVDECHFLKNPDAKRTQQVLGKVDRRAKRVAVAPIRSRRRVFMTGTPIVNRPVELWPIVQSLDPAGLGRSFFGYAKRYCAAHEGRYGWDFTGSSNLDELQRRLRATFMVRRLKEEVLTDLPPKRRQIVVLPTDEASARLIEAERAAYERWEEALSTSSAATAEFSEMSRLRHETGLAKVAVAVEFLREALDEGGKIVAFAHHRDVISALAAEFGEAAVAMTGETPIAERQAAVDRFQTDPKCRLFVGSIQAAGVGITLTAAQHVVFVELDWVPGNVTQAEDRCHRIGQRGSVLVQHLVFDGSLDMRMGEVILSKQEVIAAALDVREPEPKPVVRQIAAEPAKTPIAGAMPEDRKEAIHAALRLLAGVCDGAAQLDGQGFNKTDASFGHSLAGCHALTDRQAAAALRMVLKYRRQLPAALVERIAA